MKFILLSDRREKISVGAKNLVCLYYDSWNDYSYITTFSLYFIDDNGQRHPIGDVKIGFKGQKSSISTYEKILELSNGKTFDSLPDNFFSLATDVVFYIRIMELPKEAREFILDGLNDVVYKPGFFSKFREESVFKVSLMRNREETIIKDQFKRVLDGKPPLTDFRFSFVRPERENMGEICLDFYVSAYSRPSTNIHALIGRNGVGKTTLLNEMVKSFIDENYDDGEFYSLEYYPFHIIKNKLDRKYFGHLIVVSFSVFDPFIPNSNELKQYSYIGLKESDNRLKSPEDYFKKDFWESFHECRSFIAKKERWLNAIKNLESDNNFAEMELSRLMDENIKEAYVLETIRKMSSGHASVLLIITQLVARVDEKTLVLLDEPESHLHPPLLSAFIRALSDLLNNRNAIAIIATHSPVVLQEVPKSCVWKIERTGKRVDPFRLEIETFGENVGVLTREVFGLEVTKSGFHKILEEKVNAGGSYDLILSEFEEQLGAEARILLKTLIKIRDSKSE